MARMRGVGLVKRAASTAACSLRPLACPGKMFSRMKGLWLPVLLEDDGCTKLMIRCAGAVASCQGVEINCLLLLLMSRSWGADMYGDDVRVLSARLEFTTCCATTPETSRPYSLEH